MSEWGSDKDDDILGSEAGSDKPEREPVTYEPEYDAIEDENLYAAGQGQGIEFDKYFDIPTQITGVDPPEKAKKFSECDLEESLMENIKRCKWNKPTPIQSCSVPIVNGKRDLMACAQTGSGKTGAFCIPIINRLLKDGFEKTEVEKEEDDDDEDSDDGKRKFDKIIPLALIIAPTRELAQQIQRDFVKLCKDTGLFAQYCVGGHATHHQLDKLRDGHHIIVATPGRLADFVGKNRIDLEAVRFLVLDEADRMLDMGFKSKLEEFAHKMPDQAGRTTLMFSATFPDEIQTLAKEMLKDDYLFATVGMVGGAAESVTQTIIECERKEQLGKVIEMLEEVKSTGQKTLIFVETKRQTDFVASKLCQKEFPATSIHGDRDQKLREEALSTFISGEHPVLVATNVAARGLDIPGVDHVINMEMPKDIDEYVHRIGRTGRCGHKGKATSFFDPDKNSEIAGGLVKILANAKQEVPEFLQEFADSGPSANAGAAAAAAGGDVADSDDGW